MKTPKTLFFDCYHLLSRFCLIKEMIQKATLCTLCLQVHSFSFQTLLIRLIVFQIDLYIFVPLAGHQLVLYGFDQCYLCAMPTALSKLILKECFVRCKVSKKINGFKTTSLDSLPKPDASHLQVPKVMTLQVPTIQVWPRPLISHNELDQTSIESFA